MYLVGLGEQGVPYMGKVFDTVRLDLPIYVWRSSNWGPNLLVSVLVIYADDIWPPVP